LYYKNPVEDAQINLRLMDVQFFLLFIRNYFIIFFFQCACLDSPKAQLNEGIMITEYVTNLAEQMSVPVSKVVAKDGTKLGCLGVHLLNISSNGEIVSTLVYQADFEALQNNTHSDRLELRVRVALDRLKNMLRPANSKPLPS
jgi:hypothetical protein